MMMMMMGSGDRRYICRDMSIFFRFFEESSSKDHCRGYEEGILSGRDRYTSLFPFFSSNIVSIFPVIVK